MGLFDRFKKKKTETASAAQKSAEHKPNTDVSASAKTASPAKPESLPGEMIDDISYIREMKHTRCGVWHQYDVLLAARIYGWDTIIYLASYLKDSDLEHISEVTVSPMLGVEGKNITEEFMESGEDFTKMATLKTESGVFSVAGMSNALKAPLKIVWMNQTNVLRFFTLLDNDNSMSRYTETMIRRTFNTEDAMKLAKPFEQSQTDKSE